MCEPVSATMAVIAVASAAASLKGQADQASAQKKYQSAQADAQMKANAANAESAMKAYGTETYQQNLRLQQEREAASEEIQDIQRESLEKQGTAIASSNSMADALMADFSRSEARYKESVRHNFDMTSLQIQGQKDSAKATAESRINQNQDYVGAPIAQPDYIGAGLQVAGDLAGAYGTYKKNTTPAKG